MNSKYLIDTVILIDHLNGIPDATEWLCNLKPGEAVSSVITRAEILVGVSADDEHKVRALLAKYPSLSLQPKTADLAAALRRRHRWKLPDAFQAALATQNGLQLVTRNTNDFPPEKLDFVLVPYEL